jgi:hypothetical protein
LSVANTYMKGLIRKLQKLCCCISSNTSYYVCVPIFITFSPQNLVEYLFVVFHFFTKITKLSAFRTLIRDCFWHNFWVITSFHKGKICYESDTKDSKVLLCTQRVRLTNAASKTRRVCALQENEFLTRDCVIFVVFSAK